MPKLHTSSRPWMRTCVHAILFSLVWGSGMPAWATPAQKPLFKKAGGSVPPNLFYTLDDSGSMGWSYAPSSSTVWNGEGNSVYPLMHHSDTLTPVGGSLCLARTPDATKTTYTATEITNMGLRSSDINRIYYNPGIRYMPWSRPNPTDADFGNSVFTAAPIDPRRIYNAADGLAGSINLNTTYTNLSSNWCTTNNSQNTTNNLYPAIYYRYNASTSRFTQVRLDSAANPPADFAKDADRTDCVAVAGRCSLAEERTNFANWFTYYRTRSLLARGATSLAFSKITQDIRVGYGQLNNGGTSSEAGASNSTVTRGVRDFAVNTATRKAFFDWLYKVPYQSGTPLRRAMDDVGKYFSITNSSGPWGTSPATTAGADNATAYAQMASCRRSYQIMMTDGYWNGTASSISGNPDGTAGTTTIADNEDDKTYLYDTSASNGITTGSPYKDSNSNTLADTAFYYWANDLHKGLKNNIRAKVASANKPAEEANADLPYYNAAKKIDRGDHAFWQHLTTFTVGLGVTGTIANTTVVPPTGGWPAPVADKPTAVDDLFHAAVNGRGAYLSAADPLEYQQAIEKALTQIFSAIDAPSSVALSSFEVSSDSRRFIPSFSSPNWVGDVSAYPVDSKETIWTASEVLPAADKRNILVWNGTSAEAFNTSVSSGVRSSMGGATDALINFLRGDRTNEGNGFRCRGDLPGVTNCTQTKDSNGNPIKAGLFGDVVNSVPLLLSNNVDLSYEYLNTSEASSYRAHVDNKNKRVAKGKETSVLAVGANDGMLHILRERDGVELFAYIPQTALPNLSRLADKYYGNTVDDAQATAHRYFVDGPLTESDAYIGSKWTNVLIGTAGNGGQAVFAFKLDAADPRTLNAQSVLWEINATSGSALTGKDKLGYINNLVTVGKLKNGKWAAIFGNGMDSAAGGAYLWIIDLETGKPIVNPIQAGTDVSGNGLGGVSVVRDSNRTIVAAYAGDAKGRLWRFDLESSSSGDWKVGLGGKALLEAGTAQPITATPTFIRHPKGGLMVLFGTGQLYATGDESNTALQTLYGVWDPTTVGQTSAATTVVTSPTSQIIEQKVAATPISSSTGVAYQITSSSTKVSYTTPAGIRGWKVNQTLATGERNIYDPFMLGTIAAFNTTAPTTSQAGDPCMKVSANSFLYLLNPLTGEMMPTPLIDTNGDGVVNKADQLIGVLKIDTDGGRVQPYRKKRTYPDDGNGNSGCTGKGTGIKFATTKNSSNMCAPKPYLVRSWQQIQNPPRQ